MDYSLSNNTVISNEIVVYRFSRERLLHILSLKVSHLSQSTIFRSHEILQRHLAQHALLEEKEELQQGTYTFFAECLRK